MAINTMRKCVPPVLPPAAIVLVNPIMFSADEIVVPVSPPPGNDDNGAIDEALRLGLTDAELDYGQLRQASKADGRIASSQAHDSVPSDQAAAIARHFESSVFEGGVDSGT
jgi:hypothetical protein